MIHPVAHRKPDLSPFETRQIVVPKTLAQLEHTLIPWITEVVSHTRHPHILRATPTWLVGSAEGKDAILEAPPSLGGNVQKVRAKFGFNGMADGNWYVAWVKFQPVLSTVQKQAAQAAADEEEQEFRKRAEDAARAENSLHPKALQFKVELHSDTWVEDIKAGLGIVQREIELVHAFAKKAASIPENPFGPKDMALTMLDTSLAGLGAMEERAEKLMKVYEKVREFQDKNDEGKELADKWKEAREENARKARGEKDVLGESQKRVYEKSTGDVLAEKAIDLASKIPGGGKFVKGFAGMFFDFASANYAGLVTTIRGRAYSWYIAGLVEGLTTVPISTAATDDLDQFFYNLGLKRGSMQENESFQTQIALLWYTSAHYIVGNLLGDAKEHPDEWTFPNGYLAHWGPERLGQAMVPLLKRKEYLVD